MPKTGPYYRIRRRKTGKKTKAGTDVVERFLPVPTWIFEQGVAHEGDEYEFRPNLASGDLVWKRRSHASG